MIAAFQEKYPFLTLDFKSESASSTAPRILAEAQAGLHSWDVTTTDFAYIPTYIKEGIIRPYDFPTLVNWPEGTVDPDHYWVTPHLPTVCIAYNTDLISPDEVPTGHEDLLDPKWSGKVAVYAGDDGDLVMMLWQAWGSKERAITYLDALAKNKPILGGNASERIAQLAAGAYPITLRMSIGQVVKNQEQGAPLDWVRTEPLFSKGEPMVMAQNAPHPNAQQLFVDWYVSPEGQQAINDSRIVMRVPDPTVTGLLADAIGEQEIIVITLDTLSHAEEAADYWNNTFIPAVGA